MGKTAFASVQMDNAVADASIQGNASNYYAKQRQKEQCH